MDGRVRTSAQLIYILKTMGYPEEFGRAIASQLRTEKAMGRMISYLRNAKPKHPEEIADEMLAIMEEREAWIRKKSAEYYNQKYNETLLRGFGDEED